MSTTRADRGDWEDEDAPAFTDGGDPLGRTFVPVRYEDGAWFGLMPDVNGEALVQIDTRDGAVEVFVSATDLLNAALSIYRQAMGGAVRRDELVELRERDPYSPDNPPPEYRTYTCPCGLGEEPCPLPDGRLGCEDPVSMSPSRMSDGPDRQQTPGEVTPDLDGQQEHGHR